MQNAGFLHFGTLLQNQSLPPLFFCFFCLVVFFGGVLGDYCATKLMEKDFTACKHKTFEAVNLLLGKYRLCIATDIFKNKLINSVNSHFYE